MRKPMSLIEWLVIAAGIAVFVTACAHIEFFRAGIENMPVAIAHIFPDHRRVFMNVPEKCRFVTRQSEPVTWITNLGPIGPKQISYQIWDDAGPHTRDPQILVQGQPLPFNGYLIIADHGKMWATRKNGRINWSDGVFCPKG